MSRKIGYLRLSVTAACDLRCTYCRPEEGPCRQEGSPITPAEARVLAEHLTQRHELQKVRLTGGEPTLRPDLVTFVRELASIAAVEDLALTTNGLRLARLAGRLARAGLARVNVSLDSLNPDRFSRLTGAGPGSLARVREGILEAGAEGLSPVKLNTVVLRGENDGELGALVDFAGRQGALLRFIELMPMGPLARAWSDRFVPEAEMRERLGDLADAAHVGFVSPVSHPFCAGCDRIRVTSDLRLLPCLMDHPRGDLGPALRPTFRPDLLDRLLARALAGKSDLHPETGPCVMTTIGG